MKFMILAKLPVQNLLHAIAQCMAKYAWAQLQLAPLLFYP